MCCAVYMFLLCSSESWFVQLVMVGVLSSLANGHLWTGARHT